MRILLINDYQTLGGVEVVVDRTAAILRKAGHEVEIFAGDQHIDRQRVLGYVSSGKAKRALGKVLDRFAPDAIHIHNLYHLLSPAILSVCDRYRVKTDARVVMTAHDHHLVCPNPGRCQWQDGERVLASLPVDDGLVKMLAKRWDHRSRGHSLMRVAQWWWNYSVKGRHRIPDVIICPSQALAELMTRRGIDDVRVIQNPLPEISERKSFETNTVLTIALVGRIEPEKGIAEFIAGWPSGVKVKMRIVGDGSDVARCKEAARTRDDADDEGFAIEFLGRLSHQDTISVIAAADVLAVPSLVPEVSPLVIDEALAVGTRVLVADQQAFEEIKANQEHGWVFDPRCPKAIAEKADMLLAMWEGNDLKSSHTHIASSTRSQDAICRGLIDVYNGSSVVGMDSRQH